MYLFEGPPMNLLEVTKFGISSLIILNFTLLSSSCGKKQIPTNTQPLQNEGTSVPLRESKSILKMAENEKIVIDFSKLQFPPVIPKLGVNSVWNELLTLL